MENFNPEITAFLVVLYGSEIADSPSLKSILDFCQLFQQRDGLRLVIWNNGPDPLRDCGIGHFQSLGFETSIVETVGNISLAEIYNSFLEEIPAARYVLLDHDSQLSEDYIKCVFEVHPQALGVPRIHCKGRPRYPVIDEVPIQFSERSFLDPRGFFRSIGSGLVLGRKFVNKMLKAFGQVFDCRYVLYGVDTSLFRRLQILRQSKEPHQEILIMPGIEHSLSSLLSEPEQVQQFRKIERSYELGLTVRHYHPPLQALLKFGKVTLKYGILSILGRPQSINYSDFCKAFFTGCHYRLHGKSSSPTTPNDPIERKSTPLLSGPYQTKEQH